MLSFMTKHSLYTVYDFHNEQLISSFSLFPLVFVAIGLGVFGYNIFYGDREGANNWGINKRKFGMFFGLGFALFALSLSLAMVSSRMGAQNTTESLFETRKYKTVEGIVKDFHPMPATGHDMEHFTVNGIYFEYSDNSLGDPGYKTSEINGGVVKKDLYVKLTYINYYDRNVILKIETDKATPTTNN
jgi:hypothetical protein